MQLVRRTLAVLKQLGDAGHLTMQELATALDVPMPSMHRLLAVLVEEEFVVRTEDRHYVLGPAALSLARGTRPLDEVARPYMRALAADTGETVFLTELLGRRAVCVAIVQGSHALRLFVSVGEAMPFHAAASARVMLASRPSDEVAALIGKPPLEAFTPTTPTTLAAVEGQLAEARVLGYDVCQDELDPNVLAVSAPIRAASGEVTASLTIAAPAERHEGADRKWGAALVKAAEAISRAMGGPAGRR